MNTIRVTIHGGAPVVRALPGGGFSGTYLPTKRYAFLSSSPRSIKRLAHAIEEGRNAYRHDVGAFVEVLDAADARAAEAEYVS